MKIFLLEDDIERIKFFKQKFINHMLFISSNVVEAKKLFNDNQPFDSIFLDHDLDNRVFVESNEENTGYQFAKFLIKNVINNPQIIIHTMNGIGARNIQNELYTNKSLTNVKNIPYFILKDLILKYDDNV